MAAAKKAATSPAKTAAKPKARKSADGPVSDEVLAGDAPKRSRVAPTFLHRTHPETGVYVTFVPGEALPDWVELKGDEL